MAKRYELSDASWELIKDLASPEQKMGRPRSDDRLVLHGILSSPEYKTNGLLSAALKKVVMFYDEWTNRANARLDGIWPEASILSSARSRPAWLPSWRVRPCDLRTLLVPLVTGVRQSLTIRLRIVRVDSGLEPSRSGVHSEDRLPA